MQLVLLPFKINQLLPSLRIYEEQVNPHYNELFADKDNNYHGSKS